jgi:hypothetical protein
MMLAAQRSLFTGAFNPLSLSPALWLSDTGSNAGQWDDLSGNGRHVTQTDVSRQPVIVANALNSRQVRRFDGSNDILTNASYSTAQPFTVFVVIGDYSSTATTKNIFAGNSGNAPAVAMDSSNRPTMYAGSSIAATNAMAEPCVLSSVFNTTSSVLFENGRQVASGNAGSVILNGIRLGAWSTGGDRFIGDMAEVLLFPTALSTENRRRIEGYLSSKYNIAIS